MDMYSSYSDPPEDEDEHPNDQLSGTHDSDTLYSGLSSFSDAYSSSQEDHGYEEAFYDHYDIQLKPQQTRKPKVSKQQRSETKILLPVQGTSRRHYLFPVEILDRVCSHLSQATLRCVVRLVCKEWYTVSKQFIQRKGIWNDLSAAQENRLLEHMPSLQTLECWFGLTTGYLTYDKVLLDQSLRNSWDRFMTAITTPLQALDKDQRAGSTRPKCLLHHIRRLIFKGSRMTYEVAIPQILGHFQFLQSLELHVRWTRIPLFELLNNSPSLRQLRVVGQRSLGTEVVSGDDEDLIPVFPDPAPHLATGRPPIIDPPKTYPHRYKLQVFDIHCVVVKQRVLERLIATCPDLRVFKLHEINERIWVPQLLMSRSFPIDEERLWDHLQNCCPKVDWYSISLQENLGAEGTEPLRRMQQSNSLGRFFTTSCNVDWLDYLGDDAIRALSNVTVLEVLPNGSSSKWTESLQQLLCLMPNLLHLMATGMVFVATKVLVVPGGTRPAALRKQFIFNNRDRKRQEREERRQRRQKALERFQASTQDRKPTISEVWQCRDLRTMAMDFGDRNDHFRLFTQYIAGHRLLRNLTSLSIRIWELRIGQAKENPPADMVPPERWENDFLILQGLRCLEALDVRTRSILGVIQATDFEFLRKQNHSEVILFITSKNKDDGSDLDESSTGNKRYGRRKDRTFWPHLQSLHIKYHCRRDTINTAELVAGMEQIRPGVEFVIKRLYRY
ncbi:hypothetical protein EC968_003122 [Mortierella alpina]|nr:hypothetical protein EC968_003122 [Mortierella alpina]